MKRSSRRRFAAKLLFQYRVVVNRKSSKKRICEERTIIFSVPSARAALTAARRKGRAAQFKYRNDRGAPVRLEFVGVTDLLCLGAECARDEVWYDIREMVMPMERRKQILPTDAVLFGRA